MAWDFETDPEFQEKVDWIERFVTEEIEPLEVLGEFHSADRINPAMRATVKALQDAVKEQGLWACYLGPDLGGQGYGQMKLALMNATIGRSQRGALHLRLAAPDSGNAEILAHCGTEEQTARYLQPLLDGEIFCCYSMTEPQVSGSYRCCSRPPRGSTARSGCSTARSGSRPTPSTPTSSS